MRVKTECKRMIKLLKEELEQKYSEELKNLKENTKRIQDNLNEELTTY